jgi:2-keto-4-pentenoate hydratase/2-oxohepta-3-ene-1,7-dioic acid hydratase in catechol pathway
MPTISTDSIGKFVALGGTYHSHLDEKELTYRWPDVWVAPDEAVIPEGDTIEIPGRVNKTKPGAELTAVIGDDIYQASEQEAWEAVKGFTISNDVTAAGEWPGRSDPDLKMKTGVGYKILPTFHPIRTEYVPQTDDIDYDDLAVEIRVDGELSVSGSTSQLAFAIPELLSFASSIVHLHPGDVVAMGDPGSPTVMLDGANEVTCSIEHHGELTNPIFTQ